MRQFWTGLLVLLALALPGSPRAADQPPVFPGGGLVGMQPPGRMVEANGVAGFEDRNAKATILLLDVPLDAFDTVAKDFTDEALATQGITVTARRDLKLDAGGGSGTLLTGTQTVGPVTLRKWIALVRTDKAAALATVQYPDLASDLYPDAAVEAALRSIVFRRPLTQEEQMAALPFTLALPEGYRIVKVFGPGTVLLTKGESNEMAGSGQPYFIVSVGQGDVREDQRESFAKRAISNVPGVKELRVDRGGPLRIGGMPGSEIVATALDIHSDKEMKVAQWISFGRTGFIRMVGVAPAEGFDTTFDEMRALRDGVQLR